MVAPSALTKADGELPQAGLISSSRGTKLPAEEPPGSPETGFAIAIKAQVVCMNEVSCIIGDLAFGGVFGE